MGDVTIMVVAPSAEDQIPPMYLLQDGIWQDTTASSHLSESAKAQKEAISDELNKQMNQMRSGGNPGLGRLKADFAGHYKVLVPDDVKLALSKALQAAQGTGQVPTLRVNFQPSTEWIPWEILHDDTDFLGLRVQVARLPMVRMQTNSAPYPAQHAVTRIYSFLGNQVTNNAGPEINVLTEWRQTFSQIVPDSVIVSEEPPAINPLTYPNIDSLIEVIDGDILHITCHGGLKGGTAGMYWSLDPGNVGSNNYEIVSNIIDMLNLSTRPLVFGNACNSMAAEENGLALGFGSRFFGRGASAFIGTIAPITIPLALRFPRKFYEMLLGANGQGPLPIGLALYKTKQYFSQNQNNPNRDASFLYYCLYGVPETTFVATQPQATQPQATQPQ